MTKDKAEKKTQNQAGRPFTLTDEDKAKVIAQLSEGAYVRDIAASLGCGVSTLFDARDDDPHFHSDWWKAKERHADLMTDEMRQIADDGTPEDVAHRKLQIDTRKHLSSKQHPSRWGDKQIVQHGGTVNHEHFLREMEEESSR